MTETVEQIATNLCPLQREFLIHVCDMRVLPHATRELDRARQKLRRAGLVKMAANPRRWVAPPLGFAVRKFLQEQGS